MKKTFRGGIRIDEHKNTANIPIDRGFSPEKVIIPMSMHIGAPCTCTVAKGDYVKLGQVIGAPAEKGLSLAVHSSVSGTVSDVCEIIGINGQKVMNVIIENDGLYTRDDGIVPKDWHKMTSDEIIGHIKAAGISGMGGASFPTFAKISSALSKIDTVIVNCSECEPYITANHRLMLDYPDEVIEGVRILLKALSMPKAIFAIADNKPDAIRLIKEKTANSDDLCVQVLKTKYPQGDERQLIYAITKREIPAGKLPADVGCIVFNVETAESVWRSISTGDPFISKVVTVDGDCVRSPKNVVAPIGTRYSDLIEYCGGTDGTPVRIVSGGPMMGFTVWSTDTTVTKGCSSILVFAKDFSRSKYADSPCIRCGRCVRACPMRLMPSLLAQYAKANMLDRCNTLNARSCVECGSCSYVCPSKIPLSQYIRTAKAKINDMARRTAK